MNMQFTKRPLPQGLTALTVRGSIRCGPDCSRVEREVDALIAASETRVILDLAGVTHADSAAMGSIVRCFTKLRSAGGAMCIAGAQPMIVYSMKITRVDKLIGMFPTVDLAAQGFSGPTAGTVSQA